MKAKMCFCNNCMKFGLCIAVEKKYLCLKCVYLVANREKRFLDDIEKVCKKHRLSISHEDKHGGFEIEAFSEDNIEWLRAARFINKD